MADTIHIQLSRGLVALIDADDAERILAYKWYLKPDCGKVYAQRTLRGRSGKNTSVTLHRDVMLAQPGEIIDHVNGDGLDNRKANLRRATHAQNSTNCRPRGKYRGVHWRAKTGKWEATITVRDASQVSGRGRRIYLGHYMSEDAAAVAYNRAALAAHGEFAWLNDVPGWDRRAL